MHLFNLLQDWSRARPMECSRLACLVGHVLGEAPVLMWVRSAPLTAHLESRDGSCDSGKAGWARRWPKVSDPREAAQTGGQGVKSVPGRVWEKAGEVCGQVKVSSSGLMLRMGTLGRNVCFAERPLLC